MHDTSLSFSEIIKLNKSDVDIDKFNPYHDSKGKFTTSGGGASFSGVLLHGSPHKGIKEFDISRAGSNTGSGEKLLFFTNDKQMADDFSYERLPGSTKFMNVKGKKGEVYRTKVNMKKPLDLRNLSDDDIKAVRELDAEGILSDSDIKMMAGMKNHGSLKAALDLRPETLSRLGYDGLIANAGNGRTEFAVIDSKQTKILNKSFSELAKFNPYHDRLGRFASSGGGIGANAKASERGHIKTKSYDESIKTVKQELGCDDKQAKKYAKSVYSFTSENYEAIRAYQNGKKNDYTKKFSKDAKSVEEYIDKAPHWNGGTLYRGINLESGDVNTLFKPGTEMDMKGTSSWSSEKKIADSYTFGSGTKVIFQCDKISKATSVAHLSDTPSEKEVLVSKNTKYISKKVSKKGNVYYVYLDEVTSMAKSFFDIMKYNPNHDNLGRFSSGSGGAAAIAGSSQSYELSESNKEYLRAYTSGNYKDCCAISQSIEQGGNIQSGSYDAHEIEQTKQIMKAIDSQPVTDGELVRIESGDVDLKTGDTFTWGIRSTSRDTEFGDKVLNQADEGTENLLYSSHDDKYLGMVEYRIVGEKKALDISSYSEYDQQESLVKGKFKVLSVDKSEFKPPESKTFEQAVKDNPSLKDRYEEFTSKKGNSMVRDNETGQTYTKDKFFGRMVYYNGNMIPKEEYDIDVDSARRSYKRKTVVKVEQVL